MAWDRSESPPTGREAVRGRLLFAFAVVLLLTAGAMSAGADRVGRGLESRLGSAARDVWRLWAPRLAVGQAFAAAGLMALAVAVRRL